VRGRLPRAADDSGSTNAGADDKAADGDSEPGCAIRGAIARGEVKPWRLALLRQLLSDSGRRAQTW